MQAFFLIWGILQSLDMAWCNSCVQAQDYVCKEMPTRYPPALSSVVLFVNGVGEINTTVFNDTNLASVTSLTMTRTGITAIAPGAFDKFHQLRTLNLHNNDISQVTSTWFTHKEVLENLVLSNNSIEALNDDSFHHLLGLLTLNLTQNQISTITAGSFQSLGKLRHLDLSNNRLRHLSVETLHPVNSSKLHLDGNPWDCSCAVHDFAVYLRELQKASLLENQMEVLCDSPLHQRGLPVWNVSECETSTTVLDHSVTNSHTLPPASIEKGPINWSTLISLIVVLCALVLVICVLSVLYHKKRVRKHLLAIQPSPETLERASRVQTDCREVLENSKKVESISANLKQNQQNCSGTVALLNQRVLEPGKVSQIYQIYGTGTCQMRETSKRAKSAGPVLSRTDPVIFGRRPETELENQDDSGARKVPREEIHTGWVEKDQEKGDNREDHYDEEHCEITISKDEQRGWKREDGDEWVRTTEVENKYPQLDKVDDDNDHEKLTALKTGVKYKVKLMIERGKVEENSTMDKSKDREFLHSDEVTVSKKQDIKYMLTSSSARNQLNQEGNEDNLLQPLEDAENMPYLTIGTDPKTQTPNQEQMPSDPSSEQKLFRPIRRVLTWPPTAVQWKRQWGQNQQFLNIFPELTFIAKCTQDSRFLSNISSANRESTPQDCGAGRLTAYKSTREEATVETEKSSKGICESVIQPYIQNVSISSQDNVGINNAHPDVHGCPGLNNEAHSDLVSSSPLYEEMHSKAERENSENLSRYSGNIKIIGKMTQQTSKNEESRSEGKRKLGRTEKERRNPPTMGQNDQVQASCGSVAPPAGGSPSDDNLLVDNEYAFIDLLHEVVENHGRWTRERWRQTHLKKQKSKRFGKSH